MFKKLRDMLERMQRTFRLVIMHEEDFEEKAFMRLTMLNGIVIVSVIVIMIVAGTTTIIFLTPIREYIPGYSNVGLMHKYDELIFRLDSLEKEISARDELLYSIQSIGKVKKDTTLDTTLKFHKDYGNIPIQETGGKESKLLELVEEEPQLKNNETKIIPASSGDVLSEIFFFPPLTGIITEHFDMTGEHFGVDIVAKENEAVKAVLDGMVIFSNWTPETGYVIGIQHANNIVSFYKHNSVLLKKVGNFVGAGEAIAIIGSSGEFTTGQHMHFELWLNGKPVNPEHYIIF